MCVPFSGGRLGVGAQVLMTLPRFVAAALGPESWPRSHIMDRFSHIAGLGEPARQIPCLNAAPAGSGSRTHSLECACGVGGGQNAIPVSKTARELVAKSIDLELGGNVEDFTMNSLLRG